MRGISPAAPFIILLMKARKNTHTLAAALLVALLPVALLAAPVYDTFGSQPTDTFGGTGISNSSVARSSVTLTSGQTITLDLTAHGRYANPDPSNNGAGTFFASPGGDVLDGMPGYAKWNFGFETNSTGTLPSGYTFSLLLNNSPYFIPLPIGYDDSWNLGMGFLYGGGFNPNANATYNIALVAHNAAGATVATVAIDVQVGQGASVPDSGSTVALLGLGLVILSVASRTKRFAADRRAA